MAESVDAEIAALRERLNADTDAELAALLGLRRSAISQWRKRGRVPDRSIREAEKVEATRRIARQSGDLVGSLPPTEREMSLALAALFIVGYAQGQSDRLLRWAGMHDEVVLGAYRLLRMRQAMRSEPLAACFERLVADEKWFEHDLIEAIMRGPGELPQMLPQPWR